MSQTNALNQVRSRNFIVGTIDANGYFSVSSRPYFHATLPDAQRECIRLANSHPGKAFVPMQLSGGAYLPAAVHVQAL